MPFQQKHSFYLWGDFMSTFMVCIDLLYVTTNFLMNVCTCLIEIKWLSLLSCVLLCLKICNGKQISKFTVLLLCLCDPCETCHSVVVTMLSSLLHRWYSTLWRHQSLHQLFLPVSLCSKQSKAIKLSYLAFFWMKDLLLGLGCCNLEGNSEHSI